MGTYHHPGRGIVKRKLLEFVPFVYYSYAPYRK